MDSVIVIGGLQTVVQLILDRIDLCVAKLGLKVSLAKISVRFHPIRIQIPSSCSSTASDLKICLASSAHVLFWLRMTEWRMELHRVDSVIRTFIAATTCAVKVFGRRPVSFLLLFAWSDQCISRVPGSSEHSIADAHGEIRENWRGGGRFLSTK